jgi:hypothetical protein
MLKVLYDNGVNHYLTIEDAQRFDQRPFRSMLVRNWCAYRPGRGFHITQDGKAALHEFLSTDIIRKNPTRPLTAYFDATAYGLRKAPVHLTARRGAA